MKRRPPEILQTSMMDCGPAVLTSVLHMHGIEVSYEDVRTLCATEIDGTAPEDLARAAKHYGLEMLLRILPEETITLPDADVLPGIAVTKSTGGGTHFVVLPRTGGKRVSVMDPGQGRRLLERKDLASELFLTTLEVDFEYWLEWAMSEEAIKPLFLRAKALFGLLRARGFVKKLLATPNKSWVTVAAADAALRFASDVSEEGVSAKELLNLTEFLISQSSEKGSPIPDRYWRARPTAEGNMMVQGAMVLSAVEVEEDAKRTATTKRRNPKRLLRLQLLQKMGGMRALRLLLLSAVGAAIALTIEAVIFRAVFELAGQLEGRRQKLGLAAAMLAFTAVNWIFARSLASSSLSFGRLLEGRLRLELFQKIPLLPVRYFQTRPVSDMVERAHSIAAANGVPHTVAAYTQVAAEFFVLVAAISILAPWTWWILALCLVLGLVSSSRVLPVVTEHTRRVRTLIGSMMQYHLGAMEGVRAVRSHRAERVLRKAHSDIVQQWKRATATLYHYVARAQMLIGGLMTCLAVLLAWEYIKERPSGSGLLLLVYWATSLPSLAGRFISLNLLSAEIDVSMGRALEPLRAASTVSQLADPSVESSYGAEIDGPVSIEANGLSIVRGENKVLDDVSFHIKPGMHVAVIGASGAGKSTLMRILLGWYEHTEGDIQINGTSANARVLEALRAKTAWIDPDTYLWNKSLIANIRYGHGDDRDVTAAVHDSGLVDAMTKFPKGFATQLGESGRKLSGGEGQRVRISRAYMNEAPSLVLIDEPFRGLPSKERTDHLRALRKRWNAATIVCATHDVDDTSDFDWVLVVKDGKIVEQGSPASLATQVESTYAAMLGASLNMNAVLWASENNWRRWTIEEGNIVEQREE